MNGLILRFRQILKNDQLIPIGIPSESLNSAAESKLIWKFRQTSKSFRELYRNPVRFRRIPTESESTKMAGGIPPESDGLRSESDGIDCTLYTYRLGCVNVWKTVFMLLVRGGRGYQISKNFLRITEVRVVNIKSSIKFGHPFTAKVVDIGFGERTAY
jgi:hypothetical protein